MFLLLEQARRKKPFFFGTVCTSKLGNQYIYRELKEGCFDD
jgi:hypothetical protein